MMNRLENAARQALEALENHPGNYKLSKAECVKYNAVEAALREALAEQQAAEPNAVLVEGFSQVALRKLNDLREKGYAINGVSIATISEAGETNRGAVTTGGMVLWWPAQQATGPMTTVRSDAVNLARNMLEVRDCKGITSHGVRVLYEAVMQMHEHSVQQAAEPVEWPHKWGCRANAFGECNMGCTVQQPTQQPLTDEQIKALASALEAKGDTLRQFARAIEAAHGITSEEGGAA